MPVCINEARAGGKIRYQESRTAMLASGMEHGMEASYQRLKATV